MGFNSGALYGMVMAILLLVIVMKVRKKRAERRWRKYGEDKIYRPDEWEKHKSETTPTKQGTSESNIEGLSKTSSGSSEQPEFRSNERQEDIPPKPNPSNKPGNKRVNRFINRIKRNKRTSP